MELESRQSSHCASCSPRLVVHPATFRTEPSDRYLAHHPQLRLIGSYFTQDYKAIRDPNSRLSRHSLVPPHPPLLDRRSSLLTVAFQSFLSTRLLFPRRSSHEMFGSFLLVPQFSHPFRMHVRRWGVSKWLLGTGTFSFCPPYTRTFCLHHV